RGALQSFSFDYLATLAGRFIDWKLLGTTLVMWGLLRVASQWLRLTSSTLLGLGWMALALIWPQTRPTAAPEAIQGQATASTRSAAPAAPPGVTDVTTLDAQVQRFFDEQAARKTRFEALPADAPSFDVLVLQICSLSW